MATSASDRAGPPGVTRRTVLGAGVAAAASAVAAGCSKGTTRRSAALPQVATTVAPAGSDLGAIEHVIFLMQENRSFDHYFGSYRGVRGFDDPSAPPGVFQQTWPGGREPTLLPFHLDTATTDAECTFDLSHEWTAQHQSWNSGMMDRFVATHTSSQFEGPQNGVLTMGYYTRADLDFWYAVADAFTICDNYHCSVMGPTHPNRLHALAGTLDPAGTAGGPIIVTNSGHEHVGSLSLPTMPEVLESAGVSWKVYNPPSPLYQPASPLSMAVSDNILLYFHQHVADPTSPLFQKAFGPVYPDDFQRDVASGTLPAVSWIIPPLGYDEHPPSPPAAGEWFVSQLLATLVSNPAVWSKTALFVMYDENDGFFDHVAPPVPPIGTAGEFLSADPLPDGAGGIRGPIGFGFRVPMLVVSPFSRGGYVCSDVFDHTSQLRLLEARFGVTAPGISAWRRHTAGDLTSTLRVGGADTSLPTLPATDARSARVTSECTASQLIEVDVAHPAPYPVPQVTSLAHQEPGTARRRAG